MVKVLAAILLTMAVTAAPGLASAAPRGLERASIAQLQAKMRSERLTSEALVRFYLRRIARLDRAGPSLHAIIALNPDAIAEARALDAERRLTGARGPLHGIPILIKDNIETADPVATTAGSLALAGNFAIRDATVVARLRAAGAVILGKANLSEWANFRSVASVSGWSAVGGLVKNPYALDHSACGSSAGSAVAVAAGFAAAAVGTETDGSIVCPASMNGVVGLKPTLGRLPTTGIIPIADSQDAPGPITRTVGDAAVMLAVMEGAPPPDGPLAADLRGRRFGVLRFAPGRRPETEPVYEAALARLRAAGAILVEVRLPDGGPVGRSEQLVLATEFKAAINAYLAATPATVKTRSLADLIAFNTATPAETVLFGQEIFGLAQASKGLEDPAYREALATSKRLAGPEGIDKLLADNHLDALVAPTAGPTWKVGRDKYPGSFSPFPAVAGYPHLTLPMGQVKGGQANGRPVGLSFIGPAGSDRLLLGFGGAFEKAGPGFVAPTFPATTDDAQPAGETH